MNSEENVENDKNVSCSSETSVIGSEEERENVNDECFISEASVMSSEENANDGCFLSEASVMSSEEREKDVNDGCFLSEASVMSSKETEEHVNDVCFLSEASVMSSEETEEHVNDVCFLSEASVMSSEEIEKNEGKYKKDKSGPREHGRSLRSFSLWEGSKFRPNDMGRVISEIEEEDENDDKRIKLKVKAVWNHALEGKESHKAALSRRRFSLWEGTPPPFPKFPPNKKAEGEEAGRDSLSVRRFSIFEGASLAFAHFLPDTGGLRELEEGEEEETDDEKKKICPPPQPVDHGWAWVIAFAGFFANVLYAGIIRSTGIMVLEYKEMYHESNSMSSWVVSCLFVTSCLASPPAAMISAKFQPRTALYMAGCFGAMGFLITSFSPSIILVYFSHGVLLGLTLAFICTPVLSSIGQYFNKRAGFAFGISMSGASVGSLGIPPLIQLLMDLYEFRGMLLVMSAVMMNLVVVGAMLRPVRYYRKDKRPKVSSPPERSAEEGNLGEKKTDKPSDNSKEVRVIRFERICGKICPMWNAKLFLNPVLYIYVIGFAMATMGLVTSFYVIPAYAADQGIEEHYRTLIMFSMGFPDLVCRMLVGFVADHPKVNESVLFSVLVLIQAFVWIGITFTSGFAWMIVFALLISGLGGGIWTLMPFIFKSALGMENLGTSMGLMLMCGGPLYVALPPILAAMRDITGTWLWSYRFMGFLLTFVLLILAIEPLMKRLRAKAYRIKLKAANGANGQPAKK